MRWPTMESAPPPPRPVRADAPLRHRSPQGEEEAIKFFTPDLLNRFGSEDDSIAFDAHQEFERHSAKCFRWAMPEPWMPKKSPSWVKITRPSSEAYATCSWSSAPSKPASGVVVTSMP